MAPGDADARRRASRPRRADRGNAAGRYLRGRQRLPRCRGGRHRARRERHRRGGARAPRRRERTNGAGPMTETVYALYPCFQVTSAFADLDVDDVAQDVENLFKGWDDVSGRGVYSTKGFRSGTDPTLWL